MFSLCTPLRGYPVQSMGGAPGYPLLGLDMSTPISTGWGTPIGTGWGYHPLSGDRAAEQALATQWVVCLQDFLVFLLFFLSIKGLGGVLLIIFRSDIATLLHFRKVAILVFNHLGVIYVFP